MTHSFFLARHGNTFEQGEPAIRIGRRTDLPLTATGRNQADRLGPTLAKCAAIGRIMCGSLARTVETATRVAAYLQAPVTRDVAWLDEIDHGPDEGRGEADVLKRIGSEALDAWNKDAVLPEGWLDDIDGRISGWQQFLATLDRPALLVTSNGAARMLFRACPRLERPASLALATGAYARFDVTEGSITAYHWNIVPGGRDTGIHKSGERKDPHGAL